jgi:hypothetical protein
MKSFLVGFYGITARAQVLRANQDYGNNGVNPVNAEPWGRGFPSPPCGPLKRIILVLDLLLLFFFR